MSSHSRDLKQGLGFKHKYHGSKEQRKARKLEKEDLINR